MMDWCDDMSKAPRDGTLFDVWVTYPGSGKAERVPDVLFDGGKIVADSDGYEVEWGPDEYGQRAVATHWFLPTPPQAEGE